MDFSRLIFFLSHVVAKRRSVSERGVVSIVAAVRTWTV